jgi:hypothetical protein
MAVTEDFSADGAVEGLAARVGSETIAANGMIGAGVAGGTAEASFANSSDAGYATNFETSFAEKNFAPAGYAARALAGNVKRESVAAKNVDGKRPL